MRAARAVPHLIAIAVLTSGCPSSEEILVEPDALDCFSGRGMPAGAVEEGEVRIGADLGGYRELEPDQDLVLVEGIQGGTHFDVHARISGLDPGDPSDSRAPENPQTMFSAYSEDGTRIDGSRCGWRVGYDVVDGDAEEWGDYELSSGRRIVLLLRHRDHFGQRARLVAEVLDAQGRYARDEVWVTAVRADEDE